jgi:poly(3-hydroxybutyrate) depolymerase
MKSIYSICFVLIFALSIQVSVAQLSAKYKTYEQRWSKGLRYGLFKPDNYDPKKSYPLILYLHGANDTISRDIAWYHESIQRDNPLFVLTPKCTNANQGWGNTWTDVHSAAMATTLRVLDSLVAKYNIDKNRLYVYGISMGGFGVFSALAKEPEKFAAGYAICGGSSEKVAKKLLNTPLWIFHGEVDDVVGVQYSRQIYQEIKKEGGKVVRYTEYPGVKHNSWENVSREKTLHRWLLQQAKNKSAESPYQPTDLQPKLLPNNTVDLRWNSPTVGKKIHNEIWYYKIFRDDKPLAEIDGGVTNFNDTTVQQRFNHRYYVVAVNYNFGESKPSSTVSVVVP